MKASLFFAATLIAMNAFAEMSLGGTSNSSAPASGSTSLSSTSTTTGTSAGSPQTAGPLNSAPNGAGGTYGYPNNGVDPNTANPGMQQQQPYFGGPYYNYGGGTTSGTTTSPNAAGAPFVTPPSSTTTVQPTNGLTPSSPNGATTR